MSHLCIFIKYTGWRYINDGIWHTCILLPEIHFLNTLFLQRREMTNCFCCLGAWCGKWAFLLFCLHFQVLSPHMYNKYKVIHKCSDLGKNSLSALLPLG